METLKVIYTPEYTPPERKYPKFKTKTIEDLEIRLVSRIFGDNLISSVYPHNDLLDYQNLTLHVENIGYLDLPLEIQTKINKGIILILEFEVNKYRSYGRRIKREYWSLKKLLWECLKESQYVEFEEIRV